jgi:hypothetical protein
MTPALVEPLARAGFAVKGGVYLLLGVLALMAGLNASGGRVTDPLGAVATLLDQPFGRAAVGAVAVGLALYAAWRFLEAFADANNVGGRREGIAKRAAWGLSGAVYAFLALDVARLALQWKAGDGTDIPRSLLASPLAPWVVTLAALGIIAYAAKEIREGLARRLSERLNLRQLSREAGPIVVEISRVGIIARASVMAVMGVVLLRARTSPRRATAETDVSDSLRLIAALPSGTLLLTLMAAGLMAYGVYQLVHARYRRITPP